MRKIVRFVLLLAWCHAGPVVAQEQLLADHPLDIVPPDGLCALDSLEGLPAAETELQHLLMGRELPVAVFAPCPGSTAWPAGTTVVVGLLGRDGEPRRLDITREQYLSRLARRDAVADGSNLEDAMAAVASDAAHGTIPTGVVARNDTAIQFGFIHTYESRDESTWSYSLIGSSLMRGYPVVVTGRGPFVGLPEFDAAVGRQVELMAGLVAANTTFADTGAFRDLWWLKYAAIGLVAAVGLLVLLRWYRIRRSPDDWVDEEQAELDEEARRKEP